MEKEILANFPPPHPHQHVASMKKIIQNLQNNRKQLEVDQKVTFGNGRIER